MTLADRLRRMLDDRGYTIAETAKRAGMLKQQVHNIASGDNDNPGVKTLQRIVEAVGGTMGELFADDARKPAHKRKTE